MKKSSPVRLPLRTFECDKNNGIIKKGKEPGSYDSKGGGGRKSPGKRHTIFFRPSKEKVPPALSTSHCHEN